MSRMSTSDRVLAVIAAYLLLHAALCVCLFFMGFDFTFPADEVERSSREMYYIAGGWWSTFSTVLCIIGYWNSEL